MASCICGVDAAAGCEVSSLVFQTPQHGGFLLIPDFVRSWWNGSKKVRFMTVGNLAKEMGWSSKSGSYYCRSKDPRETSARPFPGIYLGHNMQVRLNSSISF